MSEQSKTNIGVLGAGSWGSALATLLCHNFDEVLLWGRNRQHITSIIESGQNHRYLPDVSLPGNLKGITDLEQLVAECDKYLLVVPSHGFSEAIAAIKSCTDRQSLDISQFKVFWGTKGFDPESNGLLSEVIERQLPELSCYGVISGPSFAGETVRSMPTALTLACNNPSQSDDVASWFRTPSARIYTSDDLVGVQLGGAIKNVMAIATGISDGLGFGANARAALITRGLAELTRLGTALGGRVDTFMGLAGVGDLILTCTDNQSRNRRFGIGLGQGKSTEEIKKEIGQEIEGINTTRELYQKSLSLEVEMPITEQVYQILYQQLSPLQAVKNLLGRNPKSEVI